MDNSIIIVSVVALTYLGIVIYRANLEDVVNEQLVFVKPQLMGTGESSVAQEDVVDHSRTQAGGRTTLVLVMLYGAIAVAQLISLLIFLSALAPEDTQNADSLQVSLLPATANLILTMAVTAFSIVIMQSHALRLRIKTMLERDARYNPDSRVHMAAIVLALIVLSITLGNFVASGGLTGLADQVAETEFTVETLVWTMVLEVAAAFIGIRLLFQRSIEQSARRLGLRMPTQQDITWGIGGGVVLFVILIAIAGIWQTLVSPEVFEEQTAASDSIAEAINTLPLAFAVAMSAAVGEEILFRGAMQPIFGIVPVAIFFTLLHTQYTLTPATLIILVVALGLGWLRKKYSTTTTIIAHFVYNYIQLAISLLAASVETTT